MIDTGGAGAVSLRPRRRLEVLTNSRLRAFRRCRRYHHLRYDAGLVAAADREELRFGTLVHRALEAWWLARSALPDRDRRLRGLLFESHDASDLDVDEIHDQVDSIIACALGPLGVAMTLLDADPDPFARARARAMMAGYDARWGADDRWEVLAVEDEFYAPLRNPLTGEPSRRWQLGGKRDVLVRDRETGEVLIVDHKTTSEDLSPGARYWRRLVMDSQVSLYYAGARAQGHDPGGFVHDVLRKPQLRPLWATPPEQRRYTRETKAQPSRLYAGMREHDETPAEYEARCEAEMADRPGAWFVREVVPRLDADLAEFDRDLWDEAKLIRDGEISGRHPRNTDACESYGAVCPYFDLCSGAASAGDSTRFERREQPHAELEHLPADEEAR